MILIDTFYAITRSTNEYIKLTLQKTETMFKADKLSSELNILEWILYQVIVLVKYVIKDKIKY